MQKRSTKLWLLLSLGFLVVLAQASCPFPAVAQSQTEIDLLEGWGDFEKYGVTEWESYYNIPSYDSPNYDFDANSLYYVKGTGQWLCRTGISSAAADDTVGAGWRRLSSSDVKPGENIICRLSPTGIGGSQAQYVALKAAGVELNGSAGIESVRVPLSLISSGLKPGDEVTFRVEHIRMSGYGAPSSIRYALKIQWSSGQAQRTLTPSTVAYAQEVVATLPADAAFVSAKVVIEGKVGPGQEPGLYVDGARLYIRRPGSTSYVMRSKPLSRNRSIRTFAVDKNRSIRDSFSLAQDNDTLITLLDSDYAWADHLKAINPDLKLFLYQNTRAHKTGTRDPYYKHSALGYYYISSKHPEWFYERTPGVTGDFAFAPDFPWEYWTRLANPGFQTAWVSGAQSRAIAGWHDGVTIDNLNISELQKDAQGKIVTPEIQAYEVQALLRYATLTLNAAGLETMGNACGFSLTSGLGRALFYPFWTPVAPYTGAVYTANTLATTPRHIYQEWSFVRPLGYSRMDYSKEFWKLCVDNMDEVKRWNTATGERSIPETQKRWLYVYTDIYVETMEKAFGPDGWRHFALCSYLLAQNDWTLFGWGYMNSAEAPALDLSVTSRLGVPSGDHTPYAGDIYVQYRDYAPSPDGGVGGVVVVNAYPDVSKTFRLYFDAVDEQGAILKNGQSIEIPPHAGRIFLKYNEPVSVSIRTPSVAVTPGETVTVTVDYLNGSAADAMNVVVRATVPTQLAYVAGSAEISGGSYDPSTNTVSWAVGKVAAGASGRRTFRATVK